MFEMFLVWQFYIVVASLASVGSLVEVRAHKILSASVTIFHKWAITRAHQQKSKLLMVEMSVLNWVSTCDLQRSFKTCSQGQLLRLKIGSSVLKLSPHVVSICHSN